MKKRIAAALLLLLMLLAVCLLFFHQAHRGGESADGGHETYDRHYVLITGDEDSDFWDKVYESALEEGKERGAYVERFGSQLAVDYGRNELLRLAVQASVDGIIVPGDEDEETVELLNGAVEEGIPVVTALRDSTGSLRQCFVGPNSYNLGQQYGQQIIAILGENAGSEPSRALVLVDDSRMDTSQNLVLLGIRDTLERELGESHQVSVETVSMDSTRSFAAEEAIRDIFLDTENLPDILVCLNEVHTRCAYQAAVDYNKVGTVQILGYYDSDSILDAVSKNILYSTIALDTDQMGRQCVESLDEYLETGYTNGYLSVDAQLITAEGASRILAGE